MSYNPNQPSRHRYHAMVKIQGSDTKRGTTTAAFMSLGDCAAVLGISRQAAHQLERAALHKLRIGMLPALRELNPDLAAKVERLI